MAAKYAVEAFNRETGELVYSATFATMKSAAWFANNHESRFPADKATVRLMHGATKTRIVLPDGNGKTYTTQLQHRVGDPLTWENTATEPGRRDGFNGYTVYNRHVEGDTVYLLVR